MEKILLAEDPAGKSIWEYRFQGNKGLLNESRVSHSLYPGIELLPHF
jgi:hypothetical protein